MLRSWKTVFAIMAILAAVVAICVVDLRCSGEPEKGTVAARVCEEIAVGRQELRNARADELAVLARNLRVLARRYVEQGDKKKAQRAIGAAQELDRKIDELRGEGRGSTR